MHISVWVAQSCLVGSPQLKSSTTTAEQHESRLVVQLLELLLRLSFKILKRPSHCDATIHLSQTHQAIAVVVLRSLRRPELPPSGHDSPDLVQLAGGLRDQTSETSLKLRSFGTFSSVCIFFSATSN